MVPLDGDPAESAGMVRAWIAEHGVRTLDVAGNRASQAPGIETLATAVLEKVLGDVADQHRG